ncbi:MAG: Hsp20/alpha crystallin family protein [Oscillospiraceae bacterium]|jgi:HSP20 family protein
MYSLTPFDRHHDLTFFNPFRDFDTLEKAFFGSHSVGEFKTDIYQDGDNYILEADLPGFKKDDIHVDLNGNNLTIRAERHGHSEEKDCKGNCIRSERCYGSFVRSFDVSAVKAEEIKANYNDGVLKLTMPKRDLPEKTSRTLEIQ